MQLVIAYKKQVSTTSVLVAQKFGKRHDNVLRDIDKIGCSKEFFLLNFEEIDYEDAKGRKQRMFIMTKDGFTFLVMSFKGELAAKFKEEYIQEFNRMEKVLKINSAPTLIPVYQNRILSEPTKSCPDTYWSIFDESHSVMLWVEKNVGSVSEYDLCDGSIGQRWAKYREGKEWAVAYSTYRHEYNDVRGSRLCKCYQFSEIEHFRRWLNNVYKPFLLKEYLESKYARENNVIMLERVKQSLRFLPKAS